MTFSHTKALLILGYLFVCAASIVAFLHPAESYELSIYSSTTIYYWIFVFFSLLIAVYTSYLVSIKKSLRRKSNFLGALAIISIISLPIIRYPFIASGDAFTHLGHIYEIMSGSRDPFSLRYPAFHVASSVNAHILDTPPELSMYLVVLSIILIYLLSGLVIFRNLPFNNLPTTSLYLLLCLLPINHIGSHMQFHPSTQALLFSMLPIYVFIRYSQHANIKMATILLISLVMQILFHPQQALNLFLLFLSYSVILGIFRKSSGHTFMDNPALLITTGYGIILWLWVEGLTQFSRSLERLILGVIGQDLIQATESDAGILDQLGVSIVEIFIKLFLPTLIICLSAGFFILYLSHNAYNNQKILNENNIMYVLSLSTVPIVSLFLLYFLFFPSEQYARHLGFVVLVLSIPGIIFLNHIFKTFFGINYNKYILIFIFLMLILSIPVFFWSPYIYHGNPQVTESQMSGYETMFSYDDSSTGYVSTLTPPYRYSQAILGTSQDMNHLYGESDTLSDPPERFKNEIGSTYNSGVYFTVSKRDYKWQTELLNEVRYRSADYESLSENTEVNKILSNDGFKVYLI